MSPYYYGQGWWKFCTVFVGLLAGGILLVFLGIQYLLGKYIIEPKSDCITWLIALAIFSSLTIVTEIKEKRMLEILFSSLMGFSSVIFILNSLILFTIKIHMNLNFGVEYIIGGALCIIVLVVLYH